MSFFIDKKNSLWYFIIIEQKNGSQGRKWGDFMEKQEQEEKIKQLYLELTQTKSIKRKNDLYKYIKRLKKELQIYRQLRYGTIQY